jgi:YbbR domain-containing protein
MIKTEPSKETLRATIRAAEEAAMENATGSEPDEAELEKQNTIITACEKQIKLIEKAEAKAAKREKIQAPAREAATVTVEDLERTG